MNEAQTIEAIDALLAKVKGELLDNLATMGTTAYSIAALDFELGLIFLKRDLRVAKANREYKERCEALDK